MNRTISPAPVRKNVIVQASAEHAFEVFTAGIARWWPKSHHIGATEPERHVIEPREGGRWFERGVDGVECDIGRVLRWQPPTLLVLAWQLGADWKFDPALVTEVEVRFTPLDARMTRVELEHRYLERLGERAAALREAVDAPNGWSGLLERFAQASATPPGQ